VLTLFAVFLLGGSVAVGRDVELGGAVAAAAQLPADGARALLLGTARLAFTHAMQVTLLLCAAVSVAAAIVSVIALRRSPGVASSIRPATAQSSPEISTKRYHPRALNRERPQIGRSQ
jgi:hypothetical protein